MLVGHHPFCGSILEKPAFQLNLIGRSGAPICWIGFRKNSAIRHQRIPALRIQHRPLAGSPSIL